MKLFFLTILTSSLFFVNCSKEMEGVVSTKSGLILRSEPKATANKIDLIPYNGKIIVVNANGPEETIGNIKSNWYEVKYNSKVGWAFGGFITTVKTAKEDKNEKTTEWTQDFSKVDLVTAWDKCESMGMQLPKKNHFQEAYKLGLTKGMKEDYWTGEEVKGSSSETYTYFPETNNFSTDNPVGDHFFRCVK